MVERDFTDLLSGNGEPGGDLEEFFVDIFYNVEKAVVPTKVHYEEGNSLEFYLGLPDHTLGEVKDYLKKSFENIGFVNFKSKFKVDPSRYLLVAKRDNVCYGADIRDAGILSENLPKEFPKEFHKYPVKIVLLD